MRMVLMAAVMMGVVSAGDGVDVNVFGMKMLRLPKRDDSTCEAAVYGDWIAMDCGPDAFGGFCGSITS